MTHVATESRGEPNGPSNEAEVSGKEPKGTVRRVIIPALIMLVGICVLLYPVIASQWNNYLQRQAVAEYEEQTDRLIDEEPEAVAASLEAARQYNLDHRNGPILDPWLARIAEDNAEYQDYLSQLSQLEVMSHVSIPSIESNLPVYHGTSDETLQKGIGHLYGSALPVGGEGNHSVLTGHTGLTNATLWDNLIDVKEGDAIYVSTYGEKMKYEVHGTEVVLPNETDSLKSVEGEDLLTLITCTPYGVNTHRLLVHAHRVPMDPDEGAALAGSGFTMQWWMWLVLAVAVVLLAGLIRWLVKQLKKDKDQVDA